MAYANGISQLLRKLVIDLSDAHPTRPWGESAAKVLEQARPQRARRLAAELEQPSSQGAAAHDRGGAGNGPRPFAGSLYGGAGASQADSSGLVAAAVVSDVQEFLQLVGVRLGVPPVPPPPEPPEPPPPAADADGRLHVVGVAIGSAEAPSAAAPPGDGALNAAPDEAPSDAAPSDAVQEVEYLHHTHPEHPLMAQALAPALHHPLHEHHPHHHLFRDALEALRTPKPDERLLRAMAEIDDLKSQLDAATARSEAMLAFIDGFSPQDMLNSVDARSLRAHAEDLERSNAELLRALALLKPGYHGMDSPWSPRLHAATGHALLHPRTPHGGGGHAAPSSLPTDLRKAPLTTPPIKAPPLKAPPACESVRSHRRSHSGIGTGTGTGPGTAAGANTASGADSGAAAHDAPLAAPLAAPSAAPPAAPSAAPALAQSQSAPPLPATITHHVPGVPQAALAAEGGGNGGKSTMVRRMQAANDSRQHRWESRRAQLEAERAVGVEKAMRAFAAVRYTGDVCAQMTSRCSDTARPSTSPCVPPHAALTSLGGSRATTPGGLAGGAEASRFAGYIPPSTPKARGEPRHSDRPSGAGRVSVLSLSPDPTVATAAAAAPTPKSGRAPKSSPKPAGAAAPRSQISRVDTGLRPSLSLPAL